MSAIHLLDNSITNLIAAGEVVERPASVVKELVENSIDAEATRITVEIFNGGIRKIKISDNGKGMSEEDSQKAFLKHATSKISTKDDLYSINTLGFRGEALCAISAVSKVTLVTKRRDDIFASEVYLEAGKIISKEQTSYEDGTSITVEHLFYNTPARYKFLKSEPAEAGAVTSLMECLALSRPDISFKYLINGVEKFYTTGSGDLLETIYLVCGKDFKDSSLRVSGSFSYKSGEISVSGFCGKPLFSKANRNKQYFFINGRYVKSKILQNALENAYKSYIMVGRFPVCFLFLSVDPKDVDINVHPSKLEIKFSDEKPIYELVTSSVSEAVVYDETEQNFKFFKEIPENKRTEDEAISQRKEVIDRIINDNLIKKTEPIIYADWVMSPSDESGKNTDSCTTGKLTEPVIHDIAAEGFLKVTKDSDFSEKSILPNVLTEKLTESAAFRQEVFESSSDIISVPEKDISVASESIIPEQEVLVSDISISFSVIGECFGSYVIVEKNDEIIFIDKHALHERMNFEKLKNSKEPSSQRLLVPSVFTTSSDKYAYICSNTDKLAMYGFEVEDFGDNSVLIRAVPELLSPEDSEEFLEKFADVQTDLKKFTDAELFDIFLYDIACKASVKAGKASSAEELEKLITNYFENKDKLKYCPHGRPIEFVISKKDMEKQFKRIV